MNTGTEPSLSSSASHQSETSGPTCEKVDRSKFEEMAQSADAVGDELLEWLISNGASFPDLSLKQYADEVRGVHAKCTLNKQETIMAIPKKCLITVEMGKATDIGRKLYMRRIEFIAPKHIYLMMFLLTDMEKSYYRTLPKTLKNMPIFWSEEELSWLKGSYILKQISDRKAAIKRDYDIICQVDASFSRFSLERFSWARMIVCSRNFGLTIDGLKTAALVPLADMLNHYRPRETSWTFDQNKYSFTITTLSQVSAGHQVYDSYGKKCNHRFLLNYGFAVEDNIEEDGSNPNEVMCQFLFSEDDSASLIAKKKAFIEKCGHYSPESRMSSNHNDLNTREGFSFARILVATEEELKTIFTVMAEALALYTSSRYSSRMPTVPPISSALEISALEYLRKFMIEQLNKYETTLADDNTKLKEKVYPLFSNRCQALIFIRGEKQVYQHYIDLADAMIPVLKLDWIEAKALLKQRHTGDSAIDRYAQEIASIILSKEYRMKIALDAQGQMPPSSSPSSTPNVVPPPPSGVTVPIVDTL